MQKLDIESTGFSTWRIIYCDLTKGLNRKCLDDVINLFVSDNFVFSPLIERNIIIIKDRDPNRYKVGTLRLNYR